MKLGFLYAGQGSQHPGMGQDLYETYPAFREVLDRAETDFDLKALCFQGPEKQLNQTRYTQPCMVAFAAGLTLADGTRCLSAELTPLAPGESLVTVYEGKYHQVRRMLASRGLRVTYLERRAEGALTLASLPRGAVRELTAEEIASLMAVGTPAAHL